MSLKVSILISVILLILTLVNEGFGIYILFPAIAVIMFSVRKVGVYVKFNNIILCEALPLFFATVFKLLFKSFNLVEFIITLVLRCVFIGIVVYDSKAYVYITEEREVKK